MIQLECSKCNSSLQVATKYAGKRARCSKCDNILNIPVADVDTVFCICRSCKANFHAPDQPQLATIKCPKCASDFELPGHEEMIGNGTTARFTCEHCKQKYCVSSKYAGRKFGCPNCKQPCTVPELIEEDEGEMVLDLDEFNTDEPEATEYQAMQQLDLMPDDGIESVPQIGRREYSPPKVKTSKRKSSSGPSGAGSSSAASTLIALACVVGFYIAIVVGAMFFMGGEPEDKTIKAISYNRGLIYDINKGNLNMPDGLIDFIDLVDNGGLPQNDSQIMMALGMIDIKTIEPEVVYKNVEHGASGYLIDNVVTSEEGDVLNVQIAVRDLRDQYGYLAVVITDVDGNVIATSDDTDPAIMEAYIDDFVFLQSMSADSLIFYLLIALVLVGLLNLIAMWRVLEMGGQPGWACLIPIYNMVALAQVGDRSAMLGLACALVNFVPFVGSMISIGLLIYICIGVAASYDRGILFGLGLGLLPFIFFPVLAFTENRF